jgi:flagellar biosynthesis/type III secretory pathway protein FliH
VGRIVKGVGGVIPGPVLDARAEAQSVRARARDEGRAEAAAVLVAARAEAQRLLAAARPAALSLAVKMAEKIVGRAVALDPAVMAEIVGEALDAARPRAGLLRVRVHPDDLAALAPRREALLARLADGAALELCADESVGRFGCVVETPVGRIDARLETQLAALEAALGGDADGEGRRG